MAMFEGLPQKFLLLVAGAFVLGWLVAQLTSFLSRRASDRERDPRDDRIRSLEAELRVAQTDAGKARDELDAQKGEIEEFRNTAENRDTVIDEQMQTIAQLRRDLKDSVRKTRELRAELQDRATENVKSEAKLREVETELEVSRASTDMIATGVLDYSVAPDGEEDEEDSAIIKAVKQSS